MLWSVVHRQENQRRENALGHAHQKLYKRKCYYIIWLHIFFFFFFFDIYRIHGLASSASRRCAEPHLPPLRMQNPGWLAVIYKRRRQTRGLVVILRKFSQLESNQHTSRTFIRKRIFYFSQIINFSDKKVNKRTLISDTQSTHRHQVCRITILNNNKKKGQ